MDRNKEQRAPAAASDVHNSFNIQVREDRLPSLSQAQESRTQMATTKAAGRLLQKLFRVFFLAHLFIVAVLVIFLTIRGVLPRYSRHFHAKKWYPPLLAATGLSGIVAFLWQRITLGNPGRAIRIAFWVTPLLTCAVGILVLLVGSAASLAVGAVTIVLAVILSLYACWVNPRLDYATKVLSVSSAFPPAKTTTLVIQSIILSILYSSFIVSGIGGARASGTGIDILFISVILLSLTWTAQVIRNTLQVTIARIKFINFANGSDLDTQIALTDTLKYLMESVCISSALVPIITVIRGSSRAISLVAGGTDEFLFSCADCYAAVASPLASYGNRWGLVQAGVYNKVFVQASKDTWEMIRNAGLVSLIDADLTGTFCFLCGTSGGAVCALAGGSWTIAVHKDYAIEVSLYAFLIGYFMCRVAMSWPQACVSAYYIAYAENPENQRLDTVIPTRLAQLQRYGA